jgi:hypothetical protein
MDHITSPILSITHPRVRQVTSGRADALISATGDQPQRIRWSAKPHRIRCRPNLLGDRDALRASIGWVFTGSRDPDGQHAGVVGRREGLTGDVRR